jgi:hypothetical protein
MEYAICSIVGMAIVCFLVFVRTKNAIKNQKQANIDKQNQDIITAAQVEQAKKDIDNLKNGK